MPIVVVRRADSARGRVIWPGSMRLKLLHKQQLLPNQSGSGR